MNRKNRQEFLSKLEEVLQSTNKSTGNLLYELIKIKGYNKKKIKSLAKKLHPQDYKNKYPKTAEFFRRVCFSKSENWGETVSNLSLLVNRTNDQSALDALIHCVSKRPGELKKRFVRLLKKSDLSNVQGMISMLENIDDIEILQEIKENLEKSKPTEYHEAIILTLDSLIIQNKNKEAN